MIDTPLIKLCHTVVYMLQGAAHAPESGRRCDLHYGQHTLSPTTPPMIRIIIIIGLFITALWSAHVEPNDATDDQNNAPHLCETQSLSEE